MQEEATPSGKFGTPSMAQFYRHLNRMVNDFSHWQLAENADPEELGSTEYESPEITEEFKHQFGKIAVALVCLSEDDVGKFYSDNLAANPLTVQLFLELYSGEILRGAPKSAIKAMRSSANTAVLKFLRSCNSDGNLVDSTE
jgi:hypothetical protein